MEFDAPIFESDRYIKNGWVNAYEYDNFQSLGMLHETREAAVMVSDNDTTYRIRIKVKPCLK